MDVRGLGLSKEELKALGYKVGGETEEDRGRPSPPVSSGAGARARRMWLWTLVILMALGWATSSNRRLPAPIPANRSDTLFSSARAMSQLVEIARLPHPPGSPEHDRVRAYLVERLRSLGLDPQIQTVTSVIREPQMVRAATVRNIVARVPGTASTGAVALTAHYDAAPLSPGAGDDGVGIAALLETVRAVVAGEPLRNDLIVLITDGEELGLLGTRSFVEHHPWMSEIALVMSVEMRGVSGPSLTVETGPENGHLIQAIAAANPRPAGTSLSRELSHFDPFGLDLTPFLEKGVRGINFTALGGRASHRQVTDRAEKVSEKTLQHHGLQLLAMTREFGDRDLARQSDFVSPEQVYFSLPLVGLVHYPVGWIPFISLGLIAGWVLVGLVLRFRGGSYQGALAGLLMGAILVSGSAGVGWGMFEVVRGFHPEYGLLESAFYRDGIHLLALVALAVALVTSGYGFARRKFGVGELFLGALTIPLGMAIWLGFRAPFGAMTLQWPVALSLLSAGLVAGLGPDRRFGRWEWVGFLLFSAGILSILVPNLELMADVLTFRRAPVLGGAIALGLLLILPTMEWLLRPRGWWTPLMAVVVAATLVVVATPAIQGGSDHPVLSSLIYLVDDTMESHGLEPDPPGIDPDSSFVRRVAGRWLTIPGPGEDWARSWVAEDEIGSTNPGVLLLPQEARYEVAGTGPETHMAAPRIRILEDVVEGGRRQLQLAIHSDLRGEMVGIHIADSVGELTSVNGTAWGQEGGTDPVRSMVHWGTPELGVVTVGIRLDAEQKAVNLDIIEHHLRPEEVLGEGFFSRDESLIPNAPAGSDRVIQRTRVTLTVSEPTNPTASG